MRHLLILLTSRVSKTDIDSHRTNYKKCKLAFVILYNLLLSIFWHQLSILITFHNCFLSIIYVRASYLKTWLLRQLATHTRSMFSLLFTLYSSLTSYHVLHTNVRTQNVRTRNFVFKCKKVTNFSLSLQNKPDITVRKFVFHNAIDSCAYLKRQLT